MDSGSKAKSIPSGPHDLVLFGIFASLTSKASGKGEGVPASLHYAVARMKSLWLLREVQLALREEKSSTFAKATADKTADKGGFVFFKRRGRANESQHDQNSRSEHPSQVSSANVFTSERRERLHQQGAEPCGFTFFAAGKKWWWGMDVENAGISQ
jgi:hypothetical protein